MKLELYSYFRSSCAYRVRIVLHLKKINFEYRNVDLLANLKNPTASAINEKNPMGQVPVLEVIDGDKRTLLVQSLPIIEWLEETYPNIYKILPDDALLRQKTRAIAEVINSGIQPLQNTTLLEEFVKNGVDKMAWARKVVEKGLAALETMVSETGGQFCVGDQVTLADCCLIPQMYNGRRFGVKIENYERLYAIYERCMKLEAFDKASPEKQPDWRVEGENN